MASANRTVAAVRAWQDHLITGREALEIAGLRSEQELLSAARQAETLLNRGSPAGQSANVHAFPGTFSAGHGDPAGNSARELSRCRR